MNRIDPDFLPAILHCGSLREQAHRAFGTMISRRPGGAGKTGDRGDIDNRATAPAAHRRDHGLHPQPYALLVDIDHRVPEFLAGVLEARHIENAGIVDQDIEAAEFAYTGIDRRAPISRASDVQMDGDYGARARLS